MAKSKSKTTTSVVIKWQFAFYNWQAHVNAKWHDAFDTPHGAECAAVSRGGFGDDFFVFPVRESKRPYEKAFVPVEPMADNVEHFQIKKGDYNRHIHGHRKLWIRLTPVRRLACRCGAQKAQPCKEHSHDN